MGTLQGILLPARIRKASLENLTVEIGPLPMELLDARAELGRATLNISAYPDATGTRWGILSALSQLLRDPTCALERQVRFLNHLLAELP